MRRYIIGTAGHVDHGKTEIIKALTGWNTDRLPEEQRRGISIDLGFAPYTLPSGKEAGIVDVPGHERFVHNMLAGVHGMDLVMLVVAADEGIMPQTREHLDILRLVGVSEGLVALSRIDLADGELVELVTEEIREFVKGTFLEGKPVVPCSPATGEGISELERSIDDLLSRVPPRALGGGVRLPIDRVFSVQGFGTVVTGTLVSGCMRVGEELELLPQGIGVRVRGLQVFGRSEQQVEPASRVAVNLSGLQKAQVKRGDALVERGRFGATERLQVRLELLGSAGRKLKRNTPVHLHIGTSEVIAKVIPLDADELEPSSSGFAELRCSEPVVSVRGDRFVVRSYSPVTTIGGGIVLDPRPVRRKATGEVSTALQLLESGEPEKVVLGLTLNSGRRPLPLDEIRRCAGFSEDATRDAVKALAGSGTIVELGSRVLSAELSDWVREAVFRCLKEYHREHPLQSGMHRDSLRTRAAPRLDGETFAGFIGEMSESGEVRVQGNIISLPDHNPALSAEAERLMGTVSSALKAGGLKPPSPSELAAGMGIPEQRCLEVVRLLEERGEAVHVKEDVVFHSESLEEGKRRLVDYLKAHGTIKAAEYRDLLQTSRKFAIALLEYFDSIKLTRRFGDTRRLA